MRNVYQIILKSCDQLSWPHFCCMVHLTILCSFFCFVLLCFLVWIVLTYSKNVVRKVSQHFLKLLAKHFPRQLKLQEIFYKNTVKVRYSCTKNIKSIINTHNKNVLHQNQLFPNERKCNCIRKDLCPLNGNCQAENIVYEDSITCSERTYGKNIYIVIAETTFKKRYSSHKRSFNLAVYNNDTELSKEFWKIKRRNSVPEIKWRILRKSSRFHRSSLRCNLCLNEKLEIALFKGNNILNRRTELISKCKHINKHKLLRHGVAKTKLNWYIWIEWSHSGDVFRTQSGILDDTFCGRSWVY